MSHMSAFRSVISLTLVCGCLGSTVSGAGAAQQEGIRPDATMLRFPDVSEKYIVFVYANDLWRVDRAGGVAVKLASPPGQEQFPRFDPTGKTIAFVGNYEGGRDIYTLPVEGAGEAFRVTYHPLREQFNDWTPDGKLLFADSRQSGLNRQSKLFVVDPHGGLPQPLPVPYGTRAAISPDGEWLAYTPYSRDSRTWKRYRGGMASDIWLFNLKDYSAKRITDWEGTDSLPMWHGDKIYYASDEGPNHRLNIWVYDTKSGKHEQVTHFSTFDIKWPSIGPGPKGHGEIVLQNGSKIFLVDLLSGKISPVDIVIPGDRPTLRPHDVDFSKYIQNGDISATGKRVVLEARGEIWSLPAKKGITRNLTRTSGVAERNPIWSPDGKWIAYLSDKTGEYEIYITQSDGRGETEQLTDNGTCYRYLVNWSPDSEYICFEDKTGSIYLLDVDSREITEVARDLGAEQRPVSWSSDSKWLAFSLTSRGDRYGVVNIYNVETGELTPVTSPMFDTREPTFDREGNYLYMVSSRHFASPEYSTIPADTTFVYRDTDVLLAVPLNGDVEDPWKIEVDEEEFKSESADKSEEEKAEDNSEDNPGNEADDSSNEGEPEKADSAENSSDDENNNADADLPPANPLQGRWEGTISGLSAMGLPAEFDSASLIINIEVAEDGTITGTSTLEIMGQSQSDDLGEVTFNEETGEITIRDEKDGMTSIMHGKLEGDTLSGTWEVVEMNASGTWSVTRVASEEEESKEEKEEVTIDFEGFEARAIMLPVSPGSFTDLHVNNKNQLLYIRRDGRMGAIKLFDITDRDSGERNVLSGAMTYNISADGKKLGAANGRGFAVVNAAPGQSFSKPVPMDLMHSKVDPREEWRQIFNDAWRIQRDFFYVANMHGVDWEGIRERYGAMIDDCVIREDLSYLIGEIIGEINVGHAYYFGGDVEHQPFSNVGMLGCDFEIGETDEGKAYRISRIYHGADWDVDARGPLSRKDVHEGDFLLEVNGIPLDINISPWAAFVDLAGEITELTVSEKPFVDDDARHVLVKPVNDETALRFRNWVEGKRRYVAEHSQGRIGYIYVPDTGVNGQTELFRQFFGQRHLDGLIIDDRWNGGGQIPTRFIELLNRPATNMWALRDGLDGVWPPDSSQGAKAMLINGLAGSGGDMFPALFKQAGLGPLVGTRTWGGLVGISGNPALIDGAFMSVPRFAYYNLDGTWGIEGHGVDPDIEVIDDPSLMVNGDDPQLDAAIDAVMKQIKEHPFVLPSRPPAPDRSGMGIREEDK